MGKCRQKLSLGHMAFVSLLVTSSLLSCSDNLKEDLVAPEDNQGMSIVIFSIPDEETVQFGNRETGTRVEATDLENTFNNIYLVYQYVKDGKGKDVTDNAFRIEDLTGKGSNLINGYRDYTLSFVPGQYRFFVVVNYDEYLGDGKTVANSITSIDEIEEKINNFSTSQNIIAGHLPMGCLDTEMFRNGYRISSGIVTIDGSNTNVITAPLTFLCAKVRYTILFDASSGGISEAFGEKRIRFDVNNEELPYANIYDSKIEYGQEQDLTDKIINPDFSEWNQPSSNGWTTNPKTIFEGGIPVARCYNQNIDCHQTILNRERGLYRLEVNGFYRYGRNAHWDSGNEKLAWQAHLDGTEILYAQMFVNDSESPLMSLYDEDYGNDYSGYYNTYPYFENDANIAFQAGKYINSLNYILQEYGSLTIGVKKEHTREFDWTCFDNFKLYYKSMTITGGNDIIRQNIELQRFNWPSKGVEYPQSATDVLYPNTDSDDVWFGLSKKAWQGVAYLPENLSNNKTVLHFPYCFGNQTTKKGEKTIVLFDQNDFSDPQYDNNDYRSGLERGKFYDVRIKVVKSEIEDDEFTLNVRVIDWKYKPSDTVW